ncbi:MAG: dockerin type I repeat-containing protein [Spirochaetales bacterium]|nr:dockerin type I repeat-containing protein [Spirochaetales bacterium]
MINHGGICDIFMNFDNKKERSLPLKKGIFFSTLAVLFLLFSAASTHEATGDANDDCSINIVDALLVAQYYVGIQTQAMNLGVMDVNADGTINIVKYGLTSLVNSLKSGDVINIVTFDTSARIVHEGLRVPEDMGTYSSAVDVLTPNSG